MPDTRFQTLLSRLGDVLGVANLEADEDDYCLLSVDGSLTLSIEFVAERDVLILGAGCGELPASPSAALLAELLRANHHWVGSGGGTLSLRGEPPELMLQLSVPAAQLSAGSLGEMLEAMVLNAEFWRERLVAGAGADGGGTLGEGHVGAVWPGMRA